MQGKVEICGVNTSKLKVLQNEETMELLRRTKEGDKKAREELISGNLRLVLSVIQKFSSRGENADDLFQVGCVGLIKAIDNFDITQPVRFSTYGVPMIVGEIRRYLRDNSAIRVSRSMRDTAYKVMQARERLMNQTQREPTVEQLTKELDIPRETFCLDEQLREVILSQEESWSGKGLELDVDLDSADYWGNRDLLAHVWQNLLGNAVKFTPEGGQIRIRLRREDGGVLVSVADSGPGMSEDVRQRVFEKFYQGDPSRASQGAGLGLSLAKRIVDLHRGEISVSSRQGSGTVFTVRLHFQKPQ